MQGTVPGARRRRRPRKTWMDNIKTWTGLPVEESVRMTEDRETSMVWAAKDLQSTLTTSYDTLHYASMALQDLVFDSFGRSVHIVIFHCQLKWTGLLQRYTRLTYRMVSVQLLTVCISAIIMLPRSVRLSVRPSVPWHSCPRRAAALGYRHAGCLQLSHVRTADLFADGRRSATSRTSIGGGHIVSPFSPSPRR